MPEHGSRLCPEACEELAWITAQALHQCGAAGLSSRARSSSSFTCSAWRNQSTATWLLATGGDLAASSCGAFAPAGRPSTQSWCQQPVGGTRWPANASACPRNGKGRPCLFWLRLSTHEKGSVMKKTDCRVLSASAEQPSPASQRPLGTVAHGWAGHGGRTTGGTTPSRRSVLTRRWPPRSAASSPSPSAQTRSRWMPFVTITQPSQLGTATQTKQETLKRLVIVGGFSAGGQCS